MFDSGEDTQPTWHAPDKSSSATPGSSQDDFDFEDIIRRYAGLTKSDFVAIQDKLVGAALHKSNLPDTRERANSLRRRRPSTSQSNYSINGRVGTLVLHVCQTLITRTGGEPDADSSRSRRQTVTRPG
jgi:serine/arginine repetitive matrix protein 2